MTKPAKRVSHPSVKAAVGVKAGPHSKGTVGKDKNLSHNGKAPESKKSAGKNTAKAYSAGGINTSGKVSASGKAAVKANSGSNKKAAVVKNAGTKAHVKVTEEKKILKVIKKTESALMTVASRYKAGKTESKPKSNILAKPPFTQAIQRKTNPRAHTLSTATFPTSIKSKSNQSPPFNKPAVSGATFSAPDKRKTKPTNGYKQVHNEEPKSAVQISISNLIVQASKKRHPAI